MIDQTLVILATILFIISIMHSNIYYRNTGYFIAFTLLAMAIGKDLTQIFLTIMGGLAVHMIMVFSYK